MYKKFNTKKLVLLLIVLLAVVAVVIIYDSKKGNRSFRAEMIDTDTSKITKIVIFPKPVEGKQGEAVELIREDNGWKVRSGKNLYSTDHMAVNSMLEVFSNMKTLRVAGNSKEAWKDFDVSDSSAVRTKVYSGKKLKADLYIGRFNYQQPKTRNPYDYYNQQRGTMSTYVRLDEEKTVYLVEGFLAMTFNRSINDFRNKTVINSDKANWTKLSFTYPADSSFNMVLENGKWMIDGLMADSAKVESYLNSISSVSNQSINDEIKLTNTEVYTLRIDVENFSEPIVVKAFEADSVNKYYITSSQNKDVFFTDANEATRNRVFIGKSRLLN